MFPHRVPGGARVGDTLQTLFIKVDSSSEGPVQLDTDESYSLTVPAAGTATLQAATVYGVLRGLETFSQLVQFNFSTRLYGIASAPWAIQDAPRVTYRGVMIDTARHFMPVPFLQQILDGMAYSKLNVLHWHISDDQSFPMEMRSPGASRLWQGAFSPQSRYSGRY